MGLEIGQLRLLIQGVGLEIQPGGVNVGGGNLRPLCQGLLSDVSQQHRLAPVAEVYLVPRAQGHAPDVGPVAPRLRQAHRLRGAEPLRLARVQKGLVAIAVRLHGRLVQGAVIAVFLGGQEPLFQLLELFVFHLSTPLN